MKQKGFSLLEVILAITLIMISIGYVCAHTAYVENIRFKMLVKKVETSIKNAQYMAITTGKEYNIVCTQKVIYIRPGYEKAIYVEEMGKNVYIPRDTTGKYISFNGKMAPSRGGTIELVNTALEQKAKVTIRVATGKTAVYFEPL